MNCVATWIDWIWLFRANTKKIHEWIERLNDYLTFWCLDNFQTSNLRSHENLYSISKYSYERNALFLAIVSTIHPWLFVWKIIFSNASLWITENNRESEKKSSNQFSWTNQQITEKKNISIRTFELCLPSTKVFAVNISRKMYLQLPFTIVGISWCRKKRLKFNYHNFVLLEFVFFFSLLSLLISIAIQMSTSIHAPLSECEWL